MKEANRKEADVEVGDPSETDALVKKPPTTTLRWLLEGCKIKITPLGKGVILCRSDYS